MKRKELKRELTVVGEEQDQAEETQAAEPVRAIMSFDDWWLQTQHQYKLKSDLKEAVRCHFKARGFLDNGDFTAGLRDFGFAV